MTCTGKMPTRKVEPIYTADRTCFSHILGSVSFANLASLEAKNDLTCSMFTSGTVYFPFPLLRTIYCVLLPSFWLLPWKPVSAYYVSVTMVLMSYLLQTENKCLCTLNFVYLSCFTHCFFDDITIVVIILEKKFE